MEVLSAACRERPDSGMRAHAPEDVAKTNHSIYGQTIMATSGILSFGIGIIILSLLEGLVIADASYSRSVGLGSSFGSCNRITPQNLGNRQELASTGLVSRSLEWNTPHPLPSVKIVSYKILCMGEAIRRSKFTSVSVAVQYECQGEACPLHLRKLSKLISCVL